MRLFAPRFRAVSPHRFAATRQPKSVTLESLLGFDHGIKRLDDVRHLSLEQVHEAYRKLLALHPQQKKKEMYPRYLAAFRGDIAQRKWIDWMAQQEPRPVPRLDVPTYAYGTNGKKSNGLAHAVVKAAGQLPETCRCLVVEVIGPDSKVTRSGDIFKNLLRDHPTLDELQIHFLNGSVAYFDKLDDEIEFTVDVREGGRDIRTSCTKDQIEIIRMASDWQKQLPHLLPIYELLNQLRVTAGMSADEVARVLAEDKDLFVELKAYQSTRKSWSGIDILTYERSEGRPVPFPVLKRLAALYCYDIRLLIAASNLTLFGPESESLTIPVELWSTLEYPLYIETKEDIERMQYYQDAEKYQGLGSMGWQIFAWRKDPFNYHSVSQLTSTLEESQTAITAWEYNKRPPFPNSIQTLSARFGKPIAVIVQKINDTYYYKEPIAKVFGEQVVWLDPNSNDLQLVREYAERPGSSGEYFFKGRKWAAPLAEKREYAQEMGFSEFLISSREANRTGIDRDNLTSWVRWYQRHGFPMDLLKLLAEEGGIPQGDPAYFLAAALTEEGATRVAEKAGIRKETLANIVQGQGRVPKPDTILQIKRVAPEFDAARLYRHYYPKIAQFFPEAMQDPPVLYLTRAHIDHALHEFHIGEHLYVFRMEPPDRPGLKYRTDNTLSYDEVGRIVGVTPLVIRTQERNYQDFESDETIESLAREIGMDRRALYLHCRPQILRFFSIRDPETQEPLELTDHDFRPWDIRVRERQFNLRRKLTRALMQIHLARNGQGEKDVRTTLARELHVSEKEAKKLLQTWHPMNNIEIKVLTERIPGLDYQEWYEYFNRAALSYFLGRREDGRFNYHFPDRSLDPISIMKDLIRKRYADYAERKPVLEQVNKLSRRHDKWPLSGLADIARKTGFDRRLLFLWSRYEELRPMIEAANP